MTGVEFGSILDLKIDKAYSDFLTTTETNRLIKEATVKIIGLKYAKMDDQQEIDQLSSFILTNQVFTPVNNQVYISAIGAPEVPLYNDIRAVKAKFSQLLSLTITNATNAPSGSAILVTFTGVNNLRSGEQIAISGVIGNPAANGTFYIQKIKNTQFELFSDKNLTTPVSGSGTYSSGGTISRIFYNYCQPITSDKKIDPYAQATVRLPRFEVANTAIKIYPLTETCSEITMDYLSLPSYYIDVSDAATDIEEVYHIDFLYSIADEFANLFSQSFKDQELYQTSSIELKKSDNE